MKYLKEEVKLLQSINIKREDVKEALENILDGYNKVYSLAFSQQKYINKKRPEYAKEMDENCKLREENSNFKDENKRYRELYKDQIAYIQNIEKELRMTKKLLGIQDESNSKK